MSTKTSMINRLTPAQQDVLLEALDPRIFHLIISPTEHCNFRCVYCYETFDKGRMDPSIVKGIKCFLAMKIPHLRRLMISWFGGEPLLAAGLCYDIASYAFSLCESCGVQFTGGFTTNGSLLTVDWVAKFISVNHDEYQITLDGDHDFHDKVRLRADRKETFNKIWTNLVALHETSLPFKILIRIHVRKSNEDSLLHLISRAKRELQGDERFQFGFHEVADLGGPNKGQFEITDPHFYHRAVKRLTERLSPMFAVEDMRQSDLLYICYAGKPNSLFLRPNGIIGKCTVALDDDLNKLGELREDGRIYVSGTKLKAWSEGFRTLNREALSCPLGVLQHGAGKACRDA